MPFAGIERDPGQRRGARGDGAQAGDPLGQHPGAVECGKAIDCGIERADGLQQRQVGRAPGIDEAAGILGIKLAAHRLDPVRVERQRPCGEQVDQIRQGEIDRQAGGSRSAQAASGIRQICCGQGLCFAMTTDWYQQTGGWCDEAIVGSGDAVALLRWDVTRSHIHLYGAIPSAEALVTSYKGPQTEFGWIPGTLIHEYHGPRFGPQETRRYLSRHILWDIVGGIGAVIERGQWGLLRWKDTPLARATQRVALQRPKTSEDTHRLVAEACAAEGIEVPNPCTRLDVVVQ